ncbi:hypothetical protein KAS41_01665 [Candidatus Parcubacteria bacterium]|nr:hypothetical protein [Candidatus Parcubacteria bacterium]
MEPKKYYYKKYRKDFENFWKNVPNRNDYVTGEPLFKFAGLIKKNNFDTLSKISQENQPFFLSALGCTILIDQVIFTYFKEDYQRFQGLTKYPKMWAGWMNANPWMVFHQNVRLPRNINKDKIINEFSKFAEFFIKDLKDFFEKQNFLTASWKNVKKVMLNDKDVVSGKFGEIFKKILDNEK